MERPTEGGVGGGCVRGERQRRAARLRTRSRLAHPGGPLSGLTLDAHQTEGWRFRHCLRRLSCAHDLPPAAPPPACSKNQVIEAWSARRDTHAAQLERELTQWQAGLVRGEGGRAAAAAELERLRMLAQHATEAGLAGQVDALVGQHRHDARRRHGRKALSSDIHN